MMRPIINGLTGVEKFLTLILQRVTGVIKLPEDPPVSLRGHMGDVIPVNNVTVYLHALSILLNIIEFIDRCPLRGTGGSSYGRSGY
jgi:hypothetical protein